MTATLHLKHVERRISLDPLSDAEWLRTKLGDGHILESMRYSESDIAKYGLPQVQAWIDDDHRRLQAFENGDWWFVHLEAVAVVSVMLGDCELGYIEASHSCVGGVESDSPQCHFDELTQDLVADIKAELADLGFADVESVETIDVRSDEWLIQTW